VGEHLDGRVVSKFRFYISWRKFWNSR